MAKKITIDRVAEVASWNTMWGVFAVVPGGAELLVGCRMDRARADEFAMHCGASAANRAHVVRLVRCQALTAEEIEDHEAMQDFMTDVVEEIDA